MSLKDIGEFGFIKHLAPQFDHLVPTADHGIGDDCALLSISEEDYHLVSTDLLIEDIHFIKEQITPQELGYKALAVNLSDIAAMGGQPLYSFLSLGIPETTDTTYLDQFIEGYHQLSEKYNVPLMGGDTTRSQDKLVINVTVIGRSKKTKARLRSMAQEGDLICVTGPLGDSAAGLAVLLNQLEKNEDHTALIQRHHLPEPMVNEGLWLAQHPSVHAMMDLSDGLSSDIKHLLKASNKRAIIELNHLPISPLLQRIAPLHQWDITALASSGGEDYELLFTVQKSDFQAINKAFTTQFGKPLYAIGEIKKGSPSLTWTRDQKEVEMHNTGFDHFK